MEQGLRSAGRTGVGLSALWVVLALVSDNTFHLAPLLIAGAPPVMAGFEYVPVRRMLALAGVMTMLALALTGLLSAGGRLAGTSLLPTGGAAFEGVVFSLLGGTVGAVAGWLATLRG